MRNPGFTCLDGAVLRLVHSRSAGQDGGIPLQGIKPQLCTLSARGASAGAPRYDCSQDSADLCQHSRRLEDSKVTVNSKGSMYSTRQLRSTGVSPWSLLRPWQVSLWPLPSKALLSLQTRPTVGSGFRSNECLRAHIFFRSAAFWDRTGSYCRGK